MITQERIIEDENGLAYTRITFVVHTKETITDRKYEEIRDYIWDACRLV